VANVADWPLEQPTYYEIRVAGSLDQSWSEWFDGLAITHDEHGNTVLAGPVTDQAALYGLLAKASSLGLTLIGVVRGEP
jgi:hypothetical protein